MKSIKICLANKNELKKIGELSQKFEQENCCNGIRADSEEFFASKEILVAKIDSKVIGYGYGTIEVKTKTTSQYKKGQRVFYLEEIYVDKVFRNNNVGQNLFTALENLAKEKGCEFLETTAVSKDYKKLLAFYIDKMGMDFWSAELVKKLM